MNNDIKDNVYYPTYNNRLKKEFEKLEYNSLKTIKECNRWLMNTYNISHVNYEGFDIHIANSINRQLQILFYKYPEIKEIRWIDDIDVSAELYIKNTRIGKTLFESSGLQLDQYIFNTFSNNHAVIIKDDCEYKGIWFNTIDLENKYIIYDIIKRNINKNHLSKSTYGIERTVTHEFAHYIDDFLKKNKLDGFIKNFWRIYNFNIKNKKKRNIRINQNRKAISKKLSTYASNNIHEFFAEAICEYIHNPIPRKLAKNIGEGTENAFKIYRSKKKVKGVYSLHVKDT